MALGNLGKANYAACFGGKTMLTALPGGSSPANPEPNMRGLFGVERINKFPVSRRLGKGTRIVSVRDGVSNTVAISEVLTWDVADPENTGEAGEQGNDDWRGTWILPGMGANTFSGFFPPNSTEPDVIPACGSKIPENARFNMFCRENTDSGGNIYASARSKHTGGVNAAMGDGSVRFFRDNIQREVWQALCTASGGEIINGVN